MTTPDGPAAEGGGVAEDDEVTRMQRALDVANDCASIDEPDEAEPPGDPAS